MEDLSQHVEVPKDARFVVYKFPGTTSTIEKTLLNSADEVKHHKIPKTWKDIKEAELSGNSYGVVFKNQEHNVLPKTYVIRGEVKDYLDIDDSTPDGGFEEAQASVAISHSDVTTYIKAELKDILAYIAFDPRNMILVADEK